MKEKYTPSVPSIGLKAIQYCKDHQKDIRNEPGGVMNLT